MRVMLVDPSLFTAPYDAALDRGLQANGITTKWAVRDLRPYESAELTGDLFRPPFYHGVDGPNQGNGPVWKARKVASHVASWNRLLREIDTFRPDILHLQWSVLPLVDQWMIRRSVAKVPTVLTVHDSKPFNGSPTSALQTLAFAKVLRAPDHLIVHTAGAKRELIEQGLASSKISIIPHGPLDVAGGPLSERTPRSSNERWCIVLFGRLQAYKGVDLLVEAVASLSPEQRRRIKVIIAGEPQLPIEPIRKRIEEAGLDEDTLELRAGYLNDAELRSLLENADAFVFPYRAIEASGVLFLVGGLNKWLIASDLGAFRDAIDDNVNGALLPPGNVGTLAQALLDSIGRVPATRASSVTSWEEIGATTRTLYETLIAERQAPASFQVRS